MRRSALAHTHRKADSISVGTASIDGDCDLDEKDDTKRKSRNLSEKKRRDQFNMLINELCSMVSTTSRKMDKSTVLKSTISFLRSHSEASPQCEISEVQENWKPSFLSNEEFTHLMLEALDGFIIVFSCSGKILYTSESVTSLLGYLPSDLSSSIFDIIHDSDKPALFKLLNNAPLISENTNTDTYTEGASISLLLHMKHGHMFSPDSVTYELVRLYGTYYNWNPSATDASNLDTDSNSCSSACSPQASSNTNGSTSSEWRSCFVAMVRLQTPQLLREMTISDGSKKEFSSRHSLEWKFLFLDHRAPPIIGYLPFEVLGTSGYDYYHIDDLDRVAACHEALMQTGEGTSCFYRFLTKGQQWIWLQTRYYITYHQWNSKPEFIVCTHTVFSYEEAQSNLRKSQAAKLSSEAEARVDSSSSNTSLTGSAANSDQQHSQQSTKTPTNCTPMSPAPSARSHNSDTPKNSDISTVSSSIRPCFTPMTSEPGGSRSATQSPSAPTSKGGACSTTTTTSASTSQVVNQENDSNSNVLINTQLTLEEGGLPQVLTNLTSVASTQPATPSVMTLTALPQFMELNDTTMALTFGPPLTSSSPQLRSQSNNTSSITGPASNAGSLNQTQFQDYLRCRHQLIQQQILFQQEELRRVSEQLMLVQFVPPPNLGVASIPCQPALGGLSLSSTSILQSPQLLSAQQQGIFQAHDPNFTRTFMAPSLSKSTLSTTTAIISPQAGVQALSVNTQVMPLSQEQAQVVFSRGFGPTQHPSL